MDFSSLEGAYRDHIRNKREILSQGNRVDSKRHARIERALNAEGYRALFLLRLLQEGHTSLLRVIHPESERNDLVQAVEALRLLEKATLWGPLQMEGTAEAPLETSPRHRSIQPRAILTDLGWVSQEEATLIPHTPSDAVTHASLRKILSLKSTPAGEEIVDRYRKFAGLPPREAIIALTGINAGEPMDDKIAQPASFVP